MTMPLLTVKDVAARLQVKESTIYAWASQGKIPSIKINGVIRFDAKEIEQWLETCRMRAGISADGLKRTRQGALSEIDRAIERAKRAVYTACHGETRPPASPNGKEGMAWGS